MSEALRVALATLAAYRLAELVALDEGPGSVFLRLRAALGAFDVKADGEPRTLRGRMVRCPYCVGVYAALLCAVPVLWPGAVGDALLTVLGVMGGQCLLESVSRAAATRR